MSEAAARSQYDLFISYRREGGAATALFLRERLMHCGLRVFLDITDLQKGYFDEALLKHIEAAPNFLVILSKESLERCERPDDWLRQEIRHAIRTERNIIPLLMDGFQFPAALPEDIRTLPRHQGVPYSYAYHEAMVGKILQSVEADRTERQHKTAPAVPVPVVGPLAAPRREAAAVKEETQGRVLDAAMAKEIPVGKPTELSVMIRRVDSAGLKAVLEIEGGDARPDDVRSKPFELEFPVDAQGKPGAAEVTLRVESPDFQPSTQTKKLRVPAKADSETYSFLLTPRFTGDLRVNLELCKGEVCVASRVLRTNGAPSDRAESPVKVLVSMPLSVKGVELPGARVTKDNRGQAPRDVAAGGFAEAIPTVRRPEPTAPAPPPPMAPAAMPGSSGGRPSDVEGRAPSGPRSGPGKPALEGKRALAAVFGVEPPHIERRKNVAFTAAWMASLCLLNVTARVIYSRIDSFFNWLPHWLIEDSLQAVIVLVGLRFIRRLRCAAPAIGFACLVLSIMLSAFPGNYFGRFLFTDHLPVFFQMTLFVAGLGLAVRRIENLWLALTIGMYLSFVAGVTISSIVVPLWEEGSLRPMHFTYLATEAVSAVTFATVFVLMTREGARRR